MIAHLPHRTERLILRRLRLADIDAFHAYRSRADVAALQGWSPMSKAEALAFLRREDSAAALAPDGWRQIGIATAHDDALVGDIGVHLARDLRSAEFGLSIHPDQQNLGLGSEATRALIALLFAHTPVRRVEAATDTRNTACIRLLAKSGMRQATVRTADYKGERCTELVFIRERSEG